MGAGQGTTVNRRFFKLLAKAEKADIKGGRAIVEIIKVGEKYQMSNWYKNLTGFITSAQVKEFEFEDEKKVKCILDISDNEGVCQLEFTFNFATYGLINSLLNTSFDKEVSIEAWINKTNFVGCAAKYINEKEANKWAIDLADQPKGIKYKTPGGKEETDYSNVVAYWRKKFETEIIPKAKKENFTGTMKIRSEKSDDFVNTSINEENKPEDPTSDEYWNTLKPDNE